jgi:hypothetical protein
MTEKDVKVEERLVLAADVSIIPPFLRRILRLPMGQTKYFKVERRLTYQNGAIEKRRRKGWITEPQAENYRNDLRYGKLREKFRADPEEKREEETIGHWLHKINFKLLMDPYWREKV